MSVSESQLPAVTARAGEPLPPRRWFVFPRRRERVIRRGVLATAIAPLAGAAGAVVLVAGLAGIGSSWWAGYHRDVIHTRSVQPDSTLATIETGEPLRESVTILMPDADGELRRLVVERDEADRFVNETLRRLDAERGRIRRAASEEVETIFRLAFADADDAVERYADWFFAWKRSYVVLKEAVKSSATRLVQFGNYEPFRVAVERDLRDYFLRHYSEQVLRPEHRDALIASAYEEAARRAHERWLKVVAEQDLRLRLFLAEHTRHLDRPDSGSRMSEVTLDWDAQRFKAPTYLTEDKAFDGVISIATVGAGGTIGALALRPVMERATARVFSGLGRRYATSIAGRIAFAETGAAVGSAVQPVSGTVLGAVAGGLVGLAADYALNEASAAFNRDAFVEANREALDLTVGVWRSRLEAGLHVAIDRWFDDTRAAVVQAE